MQHAFLSAASILFNTTQDHSIHDDPTIAHFDTSKYEIMANFWDLPKPLRREIYRIALETGSGIDSDRYTWNCVPANCKEHKNESHMVPALFKVSRNIKKEASSVFYDDTTFEICRPEDVSAWIKVMCPRYLRRIQRIDLFFETIDQDWDSALKLLARFKGLEIMEIITDEYHMLRMILQSEERFKWHRSLGYGPQVHLQILNLPGMTGLRKLRDLHELSIYESVDYFTLCFEPRGTIPDGVLQTIIARELIQPRVSQVQERKGHFNFKGLPAEIRNTIYSMLLISPGPTFPMKDAPTEIMHRTDVTIERRNRLPFAHSALDLLLVDKQICEEAAGLFYHHNHLVFSHAMQMQMFLLELGPMRFASIRQLSLFHQDKTLDDVSPIDTALALLRRLPNLRKFHLLVPSGHMAGRFEPNWPTDIHGVERLFTLRNLDDLKVRDLKLEDQVDGAGEWINMDESELETARIQTQAFKHFNHGLRTASQKGIVVRELYTGWWEAEDNWPVLEGSDCGWEHGCSCGDEDSASQEAAMASGNGPSRRLG